MKKVFLDHLPKMNMGKGNKIDWKQSIGYKVQFIYDDIDDEIEIISYDTKTQNLHIRYLENKNFKITTKGFVRCCLGKLLNKYTTDFKIDNGTIINDNNRELVILERQYNTVMRKEGYTVKEKWYKYRCFGCKQENWVVEGSLLKGHGCSVCSNQKIIKGINDISTTHPELTIYFASLEDSYKYSYASNKYVSMNCPLCGYVKNKKINDLSQKGFGCPKCSDGISYPEKFMFNVLEQSKICFEMQKKFKWSKNKRYDFYIEDLNLIIEVHGGQHYSSSSFEYYGGKNLTEEQENDKLKKELAKDNGIQKYIVVDCSKSKMKFIKNNIINSELFYLFDLSKINWEECDKYACSSLVKIVSDLWNNGIQSIDEISKTLKVNRSTISRYLNQGDTLGLCVYNKKEYLNTKVICINTKKIFNSIKLAESYYNVSTSSISMCCRYKSKTAGKHPETGEPLRWMYYEDYIKQTNQNQLHINPAS